MKNAKSILYLFALLAAAALISCSAPAEEGAGPEFVVFRSPT